MLHQTRDISLGFTDQSFSQGVHVCQIFTSDDEREHSLLQFVASGLKSMEKTGCFTNKTQEETMELFLKNHGISCRQARDSGLLTMSGVHEVYFKNDRFDPEEMLLLLSEFYKESLAMGCCGARVIGEMEPDVQRLPGGSRLLEYEAKVSMLQRQYPITAICQYDARQFDGATVMDVLKVHPLMIVRGNVVHNPFYIKPEDVLKQH